MEEERAVEEKVAVTVVETVVVGLEGRVGVVMVVDMEVVDSEEVEVVLTVMEMVESSEVITEVVTEAVISVVITEVVTEVEEGQTYKQYHISLVR